LIYNNWTGVHVGNKFMSKVKELGKNVFIPGGTKVANTGIDGLKAILARAYDTYTGNKNNGYFKNEQEALDWLVS
jgi:hypothetical protein